MYKKITLLILGLVAVITLALLASNQIQGAPAVFISTPSTSTPTANFSFTVGTSTPLTQFGSTTLAVYGSTTIQTPVNTFHALEVFNAASSSIFSVSTAGAASTSVTVLSITSTTATSTAAYGINMTAGCFAINGTCLPSSGVSGTGVTNALAYWTSGSAIGATSSNVTISNLIATSSSLYSSFAGGLISNASSSITDLSIERATTTNATTTNLNITGNLDVDGLTSAIVQAGSGGLFAEYAGTSCTSQFVRSLSALGAATCATVGAADVDLADLTATDATLTFSGAYDGQTARTVGLNLGNANTWTASSTWPNINLGWLISTSTSVISQFNTLGISSSTIGNLGWGLKIGTSSVWGSSQYAGLISSSTAAATYRINWNNGNTQRFILNQNTTFVIDATSSNPIDGGKYAIKICQDPTGSRTVGWDDPGRLNWWNGTTSVTQTANRGTWIGMIYDGRTQRYDIVASSTNLRPEACLP